VKHLRKALYHWQDSMGDLIIIVIGLAIVLAVAAFFWATFMTLETYWR